MGAWGTSLYANDTACDLRGDYLDKLRRGKTNEEVTQELIKANADIMGDEEEEPLFWFALADTQWNYGRLLPEVKEKALEFLSRTEELERWEESGEKQLKAWMATREKLKAKLLSPQPPEKKVYKYRLYKCKWKLGDVFAYQFHGEYSKEKGVYGQYMIFRKVTEDRYWPGHIVPTVHVYKWIGKEIPPLEKIKEMELLPQKFWPIVYIENPDKEKEYKLDLLASSERTIPKDKITFLGNIGGDDLEPCYKGEGLSGYAGKEWRFLEEEILDLYFAWNQES